jgi:hypothetical protein
MVQEVGWAPGPAWTGADNLARTGFDPRTVQPLASRYTDYAIPAHIIHVLARNQTLNIHIVCFPTQTRLLSY